MLGRANRAHAAAAAPQQPPQRQQQQQNQGSTMFLPPSSPRQVDIRAAFGQKNTTSTWTGGGSRGGPPKQHPGPLRPISTNNGSSGSGSGGVRSAPAAAAAAAAATTAATKLASLYSISDSFQDEIGGSAPLVAAAVSFGPGPPTSSALGVTYNDDDFDDDIDLEVEPPTPYVVAPAPAPAPSKTESPASSSLRHSQQDGAMPWSSSPASHFGPPPPRRHFSTTAAATTAAAAAVSSKQRQDMAEAGTGSIGSRASKRTRTLPSGWTEHGQKDHSPEPEPDKKRPGMGPELTSEDIKDLQKKMRERRQGRQPTDLDADHWDGVAQEISKAHKVKAMAITLSKEQEHVLDLVVNQNQSVFFTGPAGTGKSVLMRAIIEKLRVKYCRDPERVAVTASTGLAAFNIGGVTLHSFAGIGLGKEDVATLVRKVKRNPKARQRWLKTKCLIIDEISMVDGELFDKLSQVGRIIRASGQSWGGIQLIITGDFFQLPPVPERGREASFTFDAVTWNTTVDHTIGLTQIFRQKDPEFARMLNEMRLGQIMPDTVRVFKALERDLVFDDDLDATELFPRRHEVETANLQRLNALPGQAFTFEAEDSGQRDLKDRLLDNVLAPKALVLKEGAQVMLIKNLDENLVNGTIGKVVGFSDQQDGEGDGSYEGRIGGKPNKNKLSKLSEYTYKFGVAVSKELRSSYPVVDFSLSNGASQRVLCEPHEWKVELPNGEVQASRKQVPLILAWALSIHKAQGQTLERVRVDLRKVFERGQAYVALSRATSQQGLQVRGFAPSKVMAHPRVIEFYNKLYTAEQAARRPSGLITRFVKPVAAKTADANDNDGGGGGGIRGYGRGEKRSAAQASG